MKRDKPRFLGVLYSPFAHFIISLVVAAGGVIMFTQVPKEELSVFSAFLGVLIAYDLFMGFYFLSYVLGLNWFARFDAAFFRNRRSMGLSNFPGEKLGAPAETGPACPHCGHATAPDHVYCPYCGNRL